jgi:hypothetical protein
VRLVRADVRPHQSDQKAALSRIGRARREDRGAEGSRGAVARPTRRRAVATGQVGAVISGGATPVGISPIVNNTRDEAAETAVLVGGPGSCPAAGPGSCPAGCRPADGKCRCGRRLGFTNRFAGTERGFPRERDGGAGVKSAGPGVSNFQKVYFVEGFGWPCAATVFKFQKSGFQK